MDTNKNGETVQNVEKPSPPEEAAPSTNIVKRRLLAFWVDVKVKPFIPIKILNFLIFGAMMALFPFLTLQARSLGILESELGIIYGFIPISALLGPPMAGMLADKIGNFKYFLATMMAASGFSALLFMTIPVGRIDHPLPEVLPLSLTCSGDVPHLNVLSNHTCDFSAHVLNKILVTSCQARCAKQGSVHQLMEEPRIRNKYLISQSKEPMDSVNFTTALSETKISDYFDPTNIYQAVETSFTKEGVNNFTIQEGVCNKLNSKTLDWAHKESDISGQNEDKGHLDCYAECRALVLSSEYCSNKYTTEDINPTLTFWIYVLVRVLNSVTLATSMPLFEGAVVSILKQYDGDFGFQKVYGSLGPIIMTPLSGILIDKFSALSNTQDYRPAFYLYFVIKLLCAIVILTMDLNFKSPSKRVLKDFVGFISNPEIIVFMLMSLLAGSCFGAIDTFLFWLLHDIGANKQLMGLTLTVGNACGIPILIFATPIINKLGAVNTIILGFSFYVIRFIGYSLIYNPWLCMPFEGLECFTVALLLTAAISYASELSTIQTAATLQGMMGGLHHGVGRGLGSLVAGFIMASIGVRSMYQMMAGAAFVCASSYFVINRVFFRKAALERKIMRENMKEKKKTEAENIDTMTMTATNGGVNSSEENEMKSRKVPKVEQNSRAKDNPAFDINDEKLP